MRSEEEMFELILSTAREDERIRAVILNGSRANPNAPRDILQDYDIVYIVTEVAPFKNNLDWIDRFGERVILQTPEDAEFSFQEKYDWFVYLMQFADGNRIDLSINPAASLPEMPRDSLSVLLLDKDGIIAPFPPPNESDYLPNPPSAKEFADCCNEFWWVSAYVAKGLWRREISYAKGMLEEVVRPQLRQAMNWYIGVHTGFQSNPGKLGKYYAQYLDAELWALYLKTYSDADTEHTWAALKCMGDLFRKTAVPVAEHYGYAYPDEDDRRVCAYLECVRQLPRDATVEEVKLSMGKRTGN